MDDFTIIITPDAEEDLNALDDYITFELNAPGTFSHTLNRGFPCFALISFITLI